MEPNPFNPMQMPSPDAGQPLVDRWRTFLSDPNNQAAMMSFGASLATPMGFGATPAGHVAQAVGQAGKTITNRATEERKDFEADSRATAREASADNAALRADVARANADTAATRAAAQGANVASQIERRDMQNNLDSVRADEMQSRIRWLETRTALFPDDQEAKRQLQAAQAQLAQSRAGVVQQDADTRTQNANTRQQSARDRSLLRAQELEQRGQQGQATLDARDRAAYDKYLNEVRKRNADPLRSSKDPKERELSVQEWQKMRGGGRSSSAPGPSSPGPQPNPLQPRAPQYTQPATNVAVPPQAIEALRKDPSLAPEFDAKYGLGLSETYLGRSM